MNKIIRGEKNNAPAPNCSSTCCVYPSIHPSIHRASSIHPSSIHQQPPPTSAAPQPLTQPSPWPHTPAIFTAPSAVTSSTEKEEGQIVEKSTLYLHRDWLERETPSVEMSIYNKIIAIIMIIIITIISFDGCLFMLMSNWIICSTWIYKAYLLSTNSFAVYLISNKFNTPTPPKKHFVTGANVM